MLLYEISLQVFFLFLKLVFSEYLEQWLMFLVLTLLKGKEYRQSESDTFAVRVNSASYGACWE